jgi:CubicO group peptidase (beta-lactamase class C family)
MSRRVVLALVLTGAFGVLAALPGTGVASAPQVPPPAAVPGGPEGVFDPPSAGWYSYRSQTSDAFHDVYLDRRDDYLPVDIDINTDDGYRVGSVWQENLDGRGWRVKRNLTSDEYHDYWLDARADGFRPVETENYLVNGNRRWAGIWVRNVEGYAWASHRGQTAVEFEMSRAEHAADGLMPIDLDEYVTGGGRRYASVWVTSSFDDWRLVRNLKKQEWADTFDANADDGYRVLSFGSVLVGGKQRYFGVFVTNDNGRGWYFRRDMTKKRYNNRWYRYRDLGYRVVGLDRYQTTDGTRYAAIWRQNNDRPSWAFRSDVDTLITDVLDESSTTVPGISVAVYDEGVPVYLRGFGDADVEDGIWMDSAHIGSIASVSKAVAGVLTMRLVEQGLIDLDDLTEDLVPTMPGHHTHTVGQLLSNRGCVRHYNNGTSVIDETNYSSALAAADEFWADALVCDPTTDDEYHYSTHGYTLLGAALEAVAGDNVKDLVRDELTTPFGLGTLQPQTSSGHRMSLYKDGDEVDQPNNDWKVLGGGLDSSVDHLARFGALLADEQILSRTSFNTMWTPPTAVHNYAYGWNTGTLGRVPWVAKDGVQVGTLSYLRIYPSLDLVVAVIMNDRSGSESAVDLGTAIGDLVAAGAPS